MSQLLDPVEKGEAVTITRHGRPVAVLANADGLPLRIDHETPSVLDLNELGAGHTFTPYDAVYFELARRSSWGWRRSNAAKI